MLIWTDADQFCKGSLSATAVEARDDPEACQPDFEALWSCRSSVDTIIAKGVSELCYSKGKDITGNI